GQTSVAQLGDAELVCAGCGLVLAVAVEGVAPLEGQPRPLQRVVAGGHGLTEVLGGRRDARRGLGSAELTENLPQQIPWRRLLERALEISNGRLVRRPLARVPSRGAQ